MPKKTIQVQRLHSMINTALLQPGNSPDYRQALITTLNVVLHETGNYRGFRYLTQHEVPGEIPGIWLDDHGNLLPTSERFHNTDDTRIHFF